jgi:hypothetical protein
LAGLRTNCSRGGLLPVYDTAESYRAGSVSGGSHQQVHAVFVELVGLREVPMRALGLVVTAAAQDSGASVPNRKSSRPAGRATMRRPLIYGVSSEQQQRSFDSTCRKLQRFLGQHPC